jgi:hypothetical protein
MGCAAICVNFLRGFTRNVDNLPLHSPFHATIGRVMADYNVPGQLDEHPFENFATTRNIALARSGNRTMYKLMLDGDWYALPMFLQHRLCVLFRAPPTPTHAPAETSPRTRARAHTHTHAPTHPPTLLHTHGCILLASSRGLCTHSVCCLSS